MGISENTMTTVWTEEMMGALLAWRNSSEEQETLVQQKVNRLFCLKANALALVQSTNQNIVRKRDIITVRKAGSSKK